MKKVELILKLMQLHFDLAKFASWNVAMQLPISSGRLGIDIMSCFIHKIRRKAFCNAVQFIFGLIKWDQVGSSRMKNCLKWLQISCQKIFVVFDKSYNVMVGHLTLSWSTLTFSVPNSLKLAVTEKSFLHQTQKLQMHV